MNTSDSPAPVVAPAVIPLETSPTFPPSHLTPTYQHTLILDVMPNFEPSELSNPSAPVFNVLRQPTPPTPVPTSHLAPSSSSSGQVPYLFGTTTTSTVYSLPPTDGGDSLKDLETDVARSMSGTDVAFVVLIGVFLSSVAGLLLHKLHRQNQHRREQEQLPSVMELKNVTGLIS